MPVVGGGGEGDRAWNGLILVKFTPNLKHKKVYSSDNIDINLTPSLRPLKKRQILSCRACFLSTRFLLLTSCDVFINFLKNWPCVSDPKFQFIMNYAVF